MRKMITALSTAAALLTLGSAAAQATPRIVPGATPACGLQCFDMSSLLLGRHVIQNAYIGGDRGVGGRVGKAVDLRRASNSHPNEDFTGGMVGTLGSFCGQIISPVSYVCLNYPGSYPVYESDWSPFGNQTSLCVGISRPDVNREPVTLQSCGVSATTLWVGDMKNSTTHHGHLYMPWVNASDPNISNPLVLTVDDGSRRPANRLRVERLNLLTGHVVPDSQEFTLTFGPAA